MLRLPACISKKGLPSKNTLKHIIFLAKREKGRNGNFLKCVDIYNVTINKTLSQVAADSLLSLFSCFIFLLFSMFSFSFVFFFFIFSFLFFFWIFLYSFLWVLLFCLNLSLYPNKYYRSLP